MYYDNYKELKTQRRTLQKAFKRGRLSEETYKLKVQELDGKIRNYEVKEYYKHLGIVNANIQDGHIVIDLSCPCSYKSIFTYNKMDFALLGKDRKGYLYFECPECKQHLQYDPLTRKIRTKRGILGRLFGRFS